MRANESGGRPQFPICEKSVARTRPRVLTSRFPSSILPFRSIRADPGAPPKVNAWEAPTDIPSWKEEHIVIAVLSGWGVVIFGATKMFGGKKE